MKNWILKRLFDRQIDRDFSIVTRYEEISEQARDTRLRLDINKILFFEQN